MQALSIVPGIFMCPVVVLLGFMHQIVIAVHCLVGFASRRAGASVLVKIGVAVGLACVMFGFAEARGGHGVGSRLLCVGIPPPCVGSVRSVRHDAPCVPGVDGSYAAGVG